MEEADDSRLTHRTLARVNNLRLHPDVIVGRDSPAHRALIDGGWNLLLGAAEALARARLAGNWSDERIRRVEKQLCVCEGSDGVHTMLSGEEMSP